MGEISGDYMGLQGSRHQIAPLAGWWKLRSLLSFSKYTTPMPRIQFIPALPYQSQDRDDLQVSALYKITNPSKILPAPPCGTRPSRLPARPSLRAVRSSPR